jgi:acyl-CoA synthetase (AMP-forming)/AMP-acid ligase II
MTGVSETLLDILQRRAAEQPDDRAYVFVGDRGGEEAALTYGELQARVEVVAAVLAVKAPPGERALLLFPPGLDFLVAFFACQRARIIAVPMMLPRRLSARDASSSIVADCTPRLALTVGAVLSGARADLPQRFPGLEWIAIDDIEPAPPSGAALPLPRLDDIAFLQYTSGSTSAPKGVVVSHANIMANSRMVHLTCETNPTSTFATWIPLYHDMGLILNALQAVYIGALCVLLAPVAFLQRPLSWLRAISDYRAEIAGGPNFAFDLCNSRMRPEQMQGIDLSSWRVAFVGGEPVRAETMDRFLELFPPFGFPPTTLRPGYGMAEATLLLSGTDPGVGPIIRPVSREALQRNRIAPPRDANDIQRAVSVGRGVNGGETAIVDPETCRRLGADQIGEVWIAGPHVAQGYWGNPEATEETFGGRIEGEDGTRWLRTGDLAFIDTAGEIYITGRMKDLVIVRGVNHYPQDIEETVQDCDPALTRHGGAAFGGLDDKGEERLVIVQEVERTERHRIDLADLTGRIREAVTAEHDVAPYRIVLIRPGTLPKTTSGKIQRNQTRQSWLEGALQAL